MDDLGKRNFYLFYDIIDRNNQKQGGVKEATRLLALFCFPNERLIFREG